MSEPDIITRLTDAYHVETLNGMEPARIYIGQEEQREFAVAMDRTLMAAMLPRVHLPVWDAVRSGSAVWHDCPIVPVALPTFLRVESVMRGREPHEAAHARLRTAKGQGADTIVVSLEPAMQGEPRLQS